MTLLNYADTFRIGGATPSAVYLGATKVWPGFKPTDLSGCAVWMDATKLNLTQGATVSSWTNLGSGSQPTITGTPTFQTNALNGRPVVRITQGAGKFRWYSGTGVDKDWTLVYIGRRWQLRGGRIITAFNTASNLLVGFHQTEYDQCYVEGWLTSGVFPTASTDWKMYSASSIATDIAQFYVDGVLNAGGTFVPAKGWGGTLCISGYTDDAAVATSQEADCEIAELVMYNRRLSDAERIQVETYLRNKWSPRKLFKPTDLGTGLVGWFDANDTATVTVLTGVTNWRTKSTGSMGFAQSVNANKPSYAGATVTFVDPQVLNGTNTYSIYDAVWVGRPQPASVANWRTLFRNLNGPHVVIIENTSTRIGTYNGGFFPAGGLTWDNVWGIGALQSSIGSPILMSRDGGAMVSTGTTIGTGNASPDYLGAYQGPPPSQSWGDLKELIYLYPSPYPDAGRQQVEGYLAWKWGLSGLLPVGHPYKNAPP